MTGRKLLWSGTTTAAAIRSKSIYDRCDDGRLVRVVVGWYGALRMALATGLWGAVVRAALSPESVRHLHAESYPSQAVHTPWPQQAGTQRSAGALAHLFAGVVVAVVQNAVASLRSGAFVASALYLSATAADRSLIISAASAVARASRHPMGQRRR